MLSFTVSSTDGQACVGDCAFTAIFYTDSYCTNVYDTKAPELSFPYCNVVDEMKVSPLLAYQGKCTGSTAKPLTTSSYVYSTFGNDSICGALGQPASQYKAYNLDLCYGTDETVSIQYEYPPCSSASCPDYVALTTFYNSSACVTSVLDSVVNITLLCTNNSASPLNLTSSAYSEVHIEVTTDDNGSDDGTLSDGAVAGVAVAGVVTVGIIAAGVYVYGGSATAAILGSSGTTAAGGVGLSSAGSAGGAEMSGNVAGGTTSAMHSTAI